MGYLYIYQQFGGLLGRLDSLWQRLSPTADTKLLFSWLLLYIIAVSHCDRAQCREACRFCNLLWDIDPSQLVFVDESSVDCCTSYRGHVWAIKGKRATWKAFFCVDDNMYSIVFNKVLLIFYRFSVLPVLSLNDGILHCHLIEGSFDTAHFYTLLNAFWRTYSPSLPLMQ